MSKSTVPTSVIRRLPRYYRFLGELENHGALRISSLELSERMGSTASQIRQDFNCFGCFGQQGYGYNIKELREKIGNILGVNAISPMILLGAGNLGKAIATHIDFEKRGCRLIGIFDSNPDVQGRIIGELEVKSTDLLEEFCKTEKPIAAVLCIPKTETAAAAAQLISYGIKAFWNFSHYDLKFEHSDIIVESVHLGDSLMTLAFGLHKITGESDSGR